MAKGITIQAMRERLKKADPTPEEESLNHELAYAVHQEWVSGAGPMMKHGIWDHFKGGVYSSTQVVINVDTQEPSVVYLSTIFGTWFVRRCEEWNELVEWPDGKWRSRFVLRRVPWIAPEFKVSSPHPQSVAPV